MKSNKSVLIATIVAVVMAFGISTAGATVIKALKIKGDIPLDPTDPFWSNYGPTKGMHVTLDLDPQMVTNPMWPNPAAKWVNVKAATNGKDIAVRVEWTDPTRNDVMVQSQHYKDQQAVMFPVNQSGEEPPFTMGGDGEQVNIWQWKATWNKEGAGTTGNVGMQDMEDQYKYMAMGSGSYYMYEPDGALKLDNSTPLGEPGTKEAARDSRGAGDIAKRSTYVDFGMGKNEGVYNPGRATHNIMSDASMRVSPVEDMNAEGFSTLTTQAHQDVQGKGNWNNNRWAVVYKRALTTEDKNDTQFTGGKTPIAFAVWNGANKERNGQKGVTQWHELQY